MSIISLPLSIRLAYFPIANRSLMALKEQDPTVRLAAKSIFDTPTRRAQLVNCEAPALLVSFVFLKEFMAKRKDFRFRDWVLDSGAFSAHASGTKIDLQEYIETCQRLLAEDPLLTEVFALDVIGDHKASLVNCERMWEAGVPAIPCFHRGSPEDALLHIAKTYPKIAIGGVARLRGAAKMDFANQCFARVWPKKVHGFGFGAEKQVLALPWHSVDATNWELGPCKFGRWQKYGKMSVRGSEQNLRSEIDFYLGLERRARSHWAKEMALLNATGAPSVKLALQTKSVGRMESLAQPKAQ